MSRLNPTHPGATIREDCIATLGWTVPEAADFLHVDVRQLTAIIECREPVTLNVARRLSLVFGSTTDMWLRMQARHDRAHTRKTVRATDRIEHSTAARRVKGNAR